jgi:hypothetical protein
VGERVVGQLWRIVIQLLFPSVALREKSIELRIIGAGCRELCAYGPAVFMKGDPQSAAR